MALESGTRLGPYKIVTAIGAGGMGEVYRARDTKLDRDVALKILPVSFAADPDRLMRFEREAKTLASLNHPNIAAIYGIEETGDTRALVMELVEGEDLSERIARGPIAFDEALPVARQVAEALEAAHELGIIHRDLKPANIKVRADGTVKVLDFGLAKAMDPMASSSSSPDAANSPTMTSPALTQMGMILGTAAYMAPEQAKGKPVDRRADVWAFGCVLYEMLTGQRAFEGEDVTDTLALVVRGNPDWSRLPAELSSSLTMYLKRSLHKDPRQRLDSAQDMRLALEGAFETAAPSPAVESAAVARPVWRQSLPLLAATAIAAIVATGLVAWTLWPTSEPGMVRRFSTDLPEGLTFRNPGRPFIALSPDANAVAYNTSGGLYIRTADALDARLIPGTEASLTSPVFSPDGQQVAYWDAAGRLERIGRTGGAAVVVASGITNPFGLSWATGGTLLVGQPDGIYQVPATGGTPDLIIPAREGERLYGPTLLPDGESVLFSATKANWDQAEIVVQARGRDDRMVLIAGGNDARYVPTGHLVYAAGDGLFGMVFDPDRRTVSGGAVPLLQGLRRAGNVTGAAQYSVSATGELVYVPGSITAGTNTLVWVDREGREEPVAIAPGDYVYPRLSPDGTRVALDDRNEANDLWVWDLALETRTRLTVGEAGGQYPAWTPDGARLAFYDFAGNIAWKAANNTGTVERIALSPARGVSPSVAVYFITPDNSALVFAQLETPDSGQDIGLIAVEAAAEPVWLLEEPFNERNAELSPDGRWMAYESDESGQLEIYVRPFPNVDDDRIQVSNAGGSRPLWSRDGRELFYLESRGGGQFRLMSAAVRTGNVFSVEARAPIMDWPYFSGNAGALGRSYDVSLDGRRFLVISRGGDMADSPDRVIVVENWFEELKRLVPVR